VTSFATRAVVSCWDDKNLDSDNVIRTILEALHHPFNASSSSVLQQEMLKCVKDWWTVKKEKMRDKLMNCLTKEAFMKNQNHLDIKRPNDFLLQKLSAGSTDKPVFQTIAENLLHAQKGGLLLMSTTELSAVLDGLQADATPEQPNPFDAALASIDLPIETVFKGVDLASLMGIPTIGEIAKAHVADVLMQAAEPTAV
jgi:hypothetical protein